MKRPARVCCSTNQKASAMLGPSTMMNRLYWGMVAPKSEKELLSSGGRLTDFCCRTPEDLRRVAEDQPQRVREEQLVELFLPVQMAEEHALDDAAQQRD